MIRARTRWCRAVVTRLMLLIIATIAAIGASSPSVADEAADAHYRSPEFEAPHLSPDGEWVAFLRQDGGRQWVMVQRTSGADLRSLFGASLPLERVRHCLWTGPQSLACGMGRSVRRRGLWIEEARLHLFDLRTGAHLLAHASRDPVADRVIDTFPDDGSTLLLVHDEKGDGFPEVSRVDLGTGARQRVVAPRPPVRHWVSDGRGSVRLGLAVEKGSGSVFVRDAASGELTLLTRQELADPQAFGPIGFGSNANDLYAIRLYDGRYSLFHVDLARGGALSLMHTDPVYDVLGPLDLARATRDLLGVRYLATYPRAHFFDTNAAAAQRWIDERLPGSVNYVLERSRDGSRQLVWSESDVDPPTLHLFDAREQTLRPIGHLYPELERAHQARTQPLSYRARDGQVIPAYLTLPTGQPPVGLPAIVLVHGGPNARDYWRFDPLVQFLVAQGYAVLQANFRGSAGYGVDFLAAGAGQWGSTIHNDITDGARWLAEEGYADAGRVCIVGQSFGGYAAMLGAARESSVYRCAASIAGVSDLVALAEYKERFQFAEVWRARIGSDRSVLVQMSPLSLVHLIATPLLLIHGPDDAVVPASQSRRFAAALERAGKAHLYLEPQECDHDMTADACRRTVFEALGGFLKRHLHEDAAR
jgi:dipeptidyl aminopeptidase/acylaminoacyl peptidase